MKCRPIELRSLNGEKEGFGKLVVYLYTGVKENNMAVIPLQDLQRPRCPMAHLSSTLVFRGFNS